MGRFIGVAFEIFFFFFSPTLPDTEKEDEGEGRGGNTLAGWGSLCI